MASRTLVKDNLIALESDIKAYIRTHGTESRRFAVSRTKKQSIQTLLKDLAATERGSSLTKTNWSTLSADLKGYFQSGKFGTRSSKISATQRENVLKLTTDLTSIQSGSSVTKDDWIALTTSVRNYLQGTGSQTQVKDSAQAIIKASDITASEVKLVVDDLQAIALEFFTNAEQFLIKRGYPVPNVDDIWVGTAGNDVKLGYLGNDSLSGEDGNDALLGGLGNDALQGGNGNDTLSGSDSDDTITGGAGGDYLLGGDGNDALVGVDATALTPGLAEVDILAGGAGADRYILGDTAAVYYSDGVNGTTGLSDYAVILDFNSAQGDVVQLKGTADSYRLAASPSTTYPGTAIFQQSELVAILKDVSVSNFNTGFSFV